MPGKVERDCPACGTVYEADPGRLKHGRQTTCSRDCSYLLRGSQKENHAIYACAVCGTEIARSPAQVKAKHGAQYCSRTCHYLGRILGLTQRVVSEPYTLTAGPRTAEHTAKLVASRRAGKGYVHSDDTRARLSEATARAIAEGHFGRVSALEDEVAQVLDGLAIGYRRQFILRGAKGRIAGVADFLLSDARVLEVNGTFWHADPRVFPDGPTHASQRRNAQRWEGKVAACCALGHPLLVVWEMDLREDPAEAVRVALAAA